MKRGIPLLLFLVPTISVIALWLSSGRERLSKTQKLVAGEVPDDLFGSTPGTVVEHGPIFGWYVGLLDAVLVTVAVAAAAALLTWWLMRRRRRAQIGGA